MLTAKIGYMHVCFISGRLVPAHFCIHRRNHVWAGRGWTKQCIYPNENPGHPVRNGTGWKETEAVAPQGVFRDVGG